MLGVLAAVLVLGGCDTRQFPPRDPVFADVAPLLQRECVSCHGPDAAEAGFRTDSYLETIACPEGAGSAVEPATDGAGSESAPILAVLGTPEHEGLWTAEETELVRAWLEGGAPAREGSAHPPGWVDPRSEEFHGRALREAQWAPMFEEGPRACARCHEGAVSDGGVGAPAATPCTSCHTEPGGPVACSTCHGSDGRDYPPRDLCFHPHEAGTAGAHATHVELVGLGCVDCHGERTVDQLRQLRPEARPEWPHGDGEVQVVLGERAGDDASFDPFSRTCTTRCHTRGGSIQPSPTWIGSEALDCNSCHQSPPADHTWTTANCNLCHAEAAPDGMSLRPGPLHVNGEVDLGDGSGGCTACHGQTAADTRMMTSGAHVAHLAPSLATEFACTECHVVVRDIFDPTHFEDTGAEVTFGAGATARGASPVYADGGCTDVACHGAGLGGGFHVAPRWNATDSLASTCGACHGLPPPPPHTTSERCSSTMCHGGIVGPGPSVTAVGRELHVNGEVTLWSAP